MELQERRKIKKILYSNITLFILAVLFIVMIPAIIRIYVRNRIASGKYEETARQLEELRQRKDQLESDLARFKSAEGTDEEIRKKFNMAKPGENILVIVDKGEENDKMEKKNTGAAFLSKIWEWITE